MFFFSSVSSSFDRAPLNISGHACSIVLKIFMLIEKYLSFRSRQVSEFSENSWYPKIIFECAGTGKIFGQIRALTTIYWVDMGKWGIKSEIIVYWVDSNLQMDHITFHWTRCWWESKIAIFLDQALKNQNNASKNLKLCIHMLFDELFRMMYNSARSVEACGQKKIKTDFLVIPDFRNFKSCPIDLKF